MTLFEYLYGYFVRQVIKQKQEESIMPKKVTAEKKEMPKKVKKFAENGKKKPAKKKA